MLRVAPLPLVTTYAYVNPVVAVILGAIVLGEPIDLRTVIAGSIIVAAVALIVTARGRMAAPRASRAAAPASAPDVADAAPPDRTPQVSARIPLATRRASAITVIIGLTPMPVGNSDPSPT